MQIGKYKLSLIETGTFGLDGGAMFGIIPKPLWNKKIDSDDKNRIKLGARCLLLQSESKKILVETGIGNIWDEKFKSIYNLDFSNNTLSNSLNAQGLKEENITDVILTHLHFDHVGGAIKSENEKLIPAFPNADYHVQKKQFEWALNPSERDKGSFIPDTYIPLHENGVLKFINGNTFFDEEIELIVINGHTISQQIMKLSDGENTFLFCGDLIPTLHHIPVPYVMGYDIQPLVTVEEKNKYMNLAVEQNWKLIFGHDHINACAEIERSDKGFVPKKFSLVVGWQWPW
jgi:glyoxylase-like metal-dependent hydrolase (beta-lactamase superfamily II)